MNWKLSHYSAAFPIANGELVLVNSFLGAVTRILNGSKDKVISAIQQGIKEENPHDPVLRKLCQHGYFVKANIEESKVISEILERERNRGFSLIILPHENCNFRCVYCYESFQLGKMSPNVASGLKKLVKHNTQTWRSLAVQWFGGEPLLARSLIKELSDSFIETCTQAAVPYTAGITTNGYYLSKDVAEMLLTRRVRRFQITLDGPEKAHNSRRRLANGSGTYARVLDNLIGLREFPEAFVVRLRVNFDPDSVQLIDPWLEEMSQLFAGDKRFSISFHPIGRWGGNNDSALHVFNHDSSAEVKLALFQSAFSKGFTRDTLKDFLASHGSVCYAGKDNSVIVGSDGRLLKCTVALDEPRNHVGHLSDDGELVRDEVRWSLWTKTDNLDTSKCKSCWFNASCESRTCPRVALDNGTPPCPSGRQEMKRLVELAVYGDMAQ